MTWNPPKHQGLFLAHDMSERISRHFERLKTQTSEFIEWHLVFNPGGRHLPSVPFQYTDASRLMPNRLRETDDRLLGGGLDVCVLPCAAAICRKYVWIMEFDVDFAGDWRSFFGGFMSCKSDLLTTTLYRHAECPDWFWWDGARSPPNVARSRWHRAFMPLMRISDNFIRDYIVEIETQPWKGHYEFTFPTIGLFKGLEVSDINDINSGRALYTNTPSSGLLSPGTFVWRPSLKAYYHEQPSLFDEGFLYHPIKVEGISYIDPFETS